MTKESSDKRTVSDALVHVFETHATDQDGRIRVEDLLSAASAVCGEASMTAAGQVNPERHEFTPGSVVMSDRVNEILAGDSADWSGAGQSVFGLIRTGGLASGYAEDEFPALADVFRSFAAGIAGPHGQGWGFVPLSVPIDNRARVPPLRAAYELRPPVRAVLRERQVPVAEWPMVCALAIVSELGRVRQAIDHRIAIALVLETVNGMAKTAPMTDEALRKASA